MGVFEGEANLCSRMPPKKRKARTRKKPTTINRDDWKQRVYERNPEILHLKQCVDPWERFLCFVDTYEPGRERVKQQLSQEMILKLVLQHLTFYGFHSVRETLVKESGIDFENDDECDFTDSRLSFFIRSAIRDTEQIYNLTLDETTTEEEDKAEVELEELLCNYELMEVEPMGTGSEDINIYDEPAEGTLMQFVNMFLITYQSFTTPEILFSKLMERWNVPDHIPQAEAKIIRMKVGNVLRKWIEGYYSDFSPELVLRLEQFMKQLEYLEDKTLAILSKNLRNAVVKSEKNEVDGTKVRQFTKATPIPKINMKTIFDPQTDIFSIPAEEIARQIASLNFVCFSKIKPTEFLNQAWSKAKYKHRAMNILK